MDIEHIVATSEAHDSGLCAADETTRKQFARDLDNLTLASSKVNRCSPIGKCGKDSAEWMPEKNKCWFANRIVQVRRKWDLTIDRKEADGLKKRWRAVISPTLCFILPQNDVFRRERYYRQKTK